MGVRTLVRCKGSRELRVATAIELMSGRLHAADPFPPPLLHKRPRNRPIEYQTRKQVMIHDASVAKSVAREIDLVMSFSHKNVVRAYHFVAWSKHRSEASNVQGAVSLSVGLAAALSQGPPLPVNIAFHAHTSSTHLHAHHQRLDTPPRPKRHHHRTTAQITLQITASSPAPPTSTPPQTQPPPRTHCRRSRAPPTPRASPSPRLPADCSLPTADCCSTAKTCPPATSR